MKSVVITPETNYADIIIPTADTVRMSFLMDMLLTNEKPVSALIVVGLDTSVYKYLLKALKKALLDWIGNFVCVCDLGALYWANWHRKDLDHVRQAVEEHAC